MRRRRRRRREEEEDDEEEEEEEDDDDDDDDDDDGFEVSGRAQGSIVSHQKDPIPGIEPLCFSHGGGGLCWVASQALSRGEVLESGEERVLRVALMSEPVQCQRILKCPNGPN
eukprot:s1864_g5.t1